MKTTPCRGCGKPIVFALTTEGKRVPLDPWPPVYMPVVWDQNESPVTVLRMNKAMVSHFATCPKASDFSRNKKKTAGAEPAAQTGGVR